MYIGLSINRLEDYNVSFKIAYNKKVYSKKRMSVYVKGSCNFKSYETNKRAKERIETISREIILKEEEIKRIYIEIINREKIKIIYTEMIDKIDKMKKERKKVERIKKAEKIDRISRRERIKKMLINLKKLFLYLVNQLPHFLYLTFQENH